MKVIMVMYDSLNRRMLSPYGCDWVKTPNFQRLADRSVTFDNSYVGSMPCMPARREIHTGRYNFLHRSWGPIEPFDDSMPELLKYYGIYTHLVSDHGHYWEEGGCTYHTRYSSWEISRGQENDPWKGVVAEPEKPDEILGRSTRINWANRPYMAKEEETPQAKTFAMGMDFIKTNYEQDNWFLQIETFDPHEPFTAPQRFRDLYPHDYDGPFFDWPAYKPVDETPEQAQHVRYESAALHSMCDEYLGKVLDLMDELDLWKDTMLIVNTDHGFLLGEHNWWAKMIPPIYNEIAHTPLFIWDPRSNKQGERRASLVQTIDLPPTILEFFGIDIPKDMQGRPLKDTVASDTPIREAGLFGLHGAHVNVTDGRYVYMRGPADDNEPRYEYTLMPTNMLHTFPARVFKDVELQEPFSFTKECKTMKIKRRLPHPEKLDTMLFDLDKDPKQENPINDPEAEEMMIKHLIRLMEETDAPPEQYHRLGVKKGE
ncbi:MAG: sulfatase [Deltaproteobacteria bacterium]|nr:sulfatase [Deltaproteobacteria bacterium]MBW2322628.1 sulfatase [Deltaproteobacteria bacterium]